MAQLCTTCAGWASRCCDACDAMSLYVYNSHVNQSWPCILSVIDIGSHRHVGHLGCTWWWWWRLVATVRSTLGDVYFQFQFQFQPCCHQRLPGLIGNKFNSVQSIVQRARYTRCTVYLDRSAACHWWQNRLESSPCSRLALPGRQADRQTGRQPGTIVGTQQRPGQRQRTAQLGRLWSLVQPA